VQTLQTIKSTPALISLMTDCQDTQPREFFIIKNGFKNTAQSQLKITKVNKRQFHLSLVLTDLAS